MQHRRPVVWGCVIVIVVVVVTFLPFFPGGHDPLARPLSAMAWALGRVGLLLVPVGGLWLWASTGRESRPTPPAWLVRITIGACIPIAMVTVLVGFASSGSQVLAAVTAVFLGLLTIRLGRRLRSTQAGASRPRMAAILVVAPIVVLTCTDDARRRNHDPGAEPCDRERRPADRRDRAVSRAAWRVSGVAVLDLG